MAPQTLLDALIQKLRGCNISGDAEEAPVAVIWTDPRSEWLPLIPLLRQQLPELLCLGATPQNSSGGHRYGCAGSSIAAFLLKMSPPSRSQRSICRESAGRNMAGEGCPGSWSY